MENEKVKKKKRAVRLTEEQRKKVYKEERIKRFYGKLDEMRENSIVTFGNVLLWLYILFSSLIISIGMTVYIVVAGGETLKDAFVSSPFGITADLAFIAVMTFLFWAMFGITSFVLFLKSDKILQEKPELYKKLKIWNWRK